MTEPERTDGAVAAASAAEVAEVAAPGREPPAPASDVASGLAGAVDPAEVDPGTGSTATPVPNPGNAAAGAASPARPRRFDRFRRWFHIPRTRRGFFAVLLVLGAFGTAGAYGGATLIQWTETADFCGRCHQMGSELAAYESGPHRDVACAECHVAPGLDGWITAKINGTRQLIQVLTGNYPRPVPPPDHADLPPVKDTCERCHTVDSLSAASLVTRLTFTQDESNSRQLIGLLIRPGSGDLFDKNRGVHWHVLQDVEYWTSDEDASVIDYVQATQADGSVKSFLAQSQVTAPDAVAPDVARITSADRQRTMDCLDCHNRVGHPLADPGKSLDEAMATGVVDTSLPYIKREGMRILNGDYPTSEAAAAAADQLRTFYELNYPAIAASKPGAIDAAINEIDTLYKLTATPDMKVTARTYPDLLGHQNFPGCFRCHDGGHYLVKDGKLTSTTIPSTCDTCHTFPQLGPAVASLPVGVPPPTHTDKLWVFNHKNVVTSLDPGGTSCGECHARDYCVNCHSTGAVNVDHDEMLTNHAAVILKAGNTACAYCHQPVFCARCHAEPVLPSQVTGSPSPEEPDVLPSPSPGAQGMRWPLVAGTATRPTAAGP